MEESRWKKNNVRFLAFLCEFVWYVYYAYIFLQKSCCHRVWPTALEQSNTDMHSLLYLYKMSKIYSISVNCEHEWTCDMAWNTSLCLELMPPARVASYCTNWHNAFIDNLLLPSAPWKQWEVRLAADRLQKQHRRAEETVQQHGSRLKRLRPTQAQRLTAETEEQRAARLQQLTAIPLICLQDGRVFMLHAQYFLS